MSLKIPAGRITLQRGALLLDLFEADIVVSIEQPVVLMKEDSSSNAADSSSFSPPVVSVSVSEPIDKKASKQKNKKEKEKRSEIPESEQGIDINNNNKPSSPSTSHPIILNIEIDLAGRQQEAKKILYPRRDLILAKAGIQVTRLHLTESRLLNTPERVDLFDKLSRDIVDLYSSVWKNHGVVVGPVVVDE